MLGKVLSTSFLDTARWKVHKYRSVPSDNAVLRPQDDCSAEEIYLPSTGH